VREAAAIALGKTTADMKPTEAETKRIKRLIANLAEIDSPDVGYSPTMAGSAFAPVDAAEHFNAFIVANHGLKHNAAFTRLVELGPAALPFLLESLKDRTPTKLSCAHHLAMGSMWESHEIDANVVNSHEANILKNVDTIDDDGSDGEHSLDGYAVKIGDICFVAIGQITNRPYTAVRYQPTGCIVVNSPVDDPELAAQVRAIWNRPEYRQSLLDSLVIDFCPEDASRDDYRYDAATRLAYYFPDMADSLVIPRLTELEAKAASQATQDDTSSLVSLITAVSAAKSPRLRAKLLDIFRTTSDPQSLLAAMPAVGKEHDELVFRCIVECIHALPERSHNVGGIAYSLLVALGNRFPNRAESVFRDYIKPKTVARCETVISVLGETCGELAIPILTPLLEDTRSLGRSYSTDDSQAGPHYPLRVCDLAAETIAAQTPTLTFAPEGDREDADRQIRVMLRNIAKMKSSETDKNRSRPSL
jgi:hypothetical protein